MPNQVKIIHLSLFVFLLAFFCRKVLKEIENVNYAPVIEKLRIEIPAKMRKYNTSGLSIAIIDKEKTIWATGFGYTDKSGKDTVTSKTIFNVQSVSKPIIVTGVLKAYKNGLINLDDPVNKHIPDFSVNCSFDPDVSRKITIRHLLSHHSGLPHIAPKGNEFSDKKVSFKEHILSIMDTWVKFPPKKAFYYSNLGYDLLGYALEKVSNNTFEQYFKEEVFKPLDMLSSTFSRKKAESLGRVAIGYNDNLEIEKSNIPEFPATGMYSNVEDMANFLSFYIAKGNFKGNQIINRKSIKEAFEVQFARKEQIGGYGFGVFKIPSFGTYIYAHAGHGSGYNAIIQLIPKLKLATVILANQQNHYLYDLGYRVLELMIEAKYSFVPEDRPIKFTSKHVIKLSPDKLRYLQGTYVPRGVVRTFKVINGNLYDVFPQYKIKLSAHSYTEFTSSNAFYEFELNQNGLPSGVHVISPYTKSYMPLNDTPFDIYGPNRKEWFKYIGAYRAKNAGKYLITTITIRNGYLYLSWSGALKLKEYKPGFFFTADNETVIFKDDTLYYGNRPAIKENNPVEELTHLINTDSGSDRLSENYINDLAYAFLGLGEISTAIALLRINTGLFPKSERAWTNLGEIYLQKDDLSNVKKCIKKALEINYDYKKAKIILKRIENY